MEPGVCIMELDGHAAGAQVLRKLNVLVIDVALARVDFVDGGDEVGFLDAACVLVFLQLVAVDCVGESVFGGVVGLVWLDLFRGGA